jgi:hypothetical protein
VLDHRKTLAESGDIHLPEAAAPVPCPLCENRATVAEATKITHLQEQLHKITYLQEQLHHIAHYPNLTAAGMRNSARAALGEPDAEPTGEQP